MNSLLNDDREDIEDTYRSRASNDREITLGTMTILGMFFALAVLCAVFFAFGYTTGRNNTPKTSQAIQAAPNPSFNATSASGAKPSAATNPYAAPVPSAASSLPELTPVPAPRSAAVTRNSGPDPDGLVVGVPPAPRAIPVAATTPTAVTASPSTPGSFMVQVAAVSHQEDADLLINTLKRVHYDVAVHHEPQDKLLHVQVGPFANRADAQAMRQRLLADGFNAIVK